MRDLSWCAGDLVFAASSIFLRHSGGGRSEGKYLPTSRMTRNSSYGSLEALLRSSSSAVVHLRGVRDQRRACVAG
jgi:hypothetical protein